MYAIRSYYVCWQGEDLRGWRPRAYARQVALLPQAQETPEGIRVAEAVAYGRAPHTGLWGRLGAEDLRQVALLPQNWLFQPRYKKLREKLLCQYLWQMLARLRNNFV